MQLRRRSRWKHGSAVRREGQRARTFEIMSVQYGKAKGLAFICLLLSSVLSLRMAEAAFYTSAFSPISCKQLRSATTGPLKGGPSNNTDNGSPATTTGKGTARLSGPKNTDATNAVDSVLTLLSSDGASIILGLLGITICLINRLIHIDDYDALTAIQDGADALGRQSRADLLAVFASGAILLNGISKLDVTSALAESVVLDGTVLERPIIFWDSIANAGVDANILEHKASIEKELVWGLESVVDATPANTAVIMANNGNGWMPIASSGTVPNDESLRNAIPDGRTTPILDRFLPTSSGGASTKESYLPTLQALPGRVEFTYIPPNTQEALVLPMVSGPISAVLVLGSNTAKSCTPRDVAWSQVIASRVGKVLLS